jgi:hypothetical protein
MRLCCRLRLHSAGSSTHPHACRGSSTGREQPPVPSPLNAEVSDGGGHQAPESVNDRHPPPFARPKRLDRGWLISIRLPRIIPDNARCGKDAQDRHAAQEEEGEPWRGLMKSRSPHFWREDCANNGQEQWNAASSGEHRSEGGPLPASDLIAAKKAGYQDSRHCGGTGPRCDPEDAHNYLSRVHWSTMLTTGGGPAMPSV